MSEQPNPYGFDWPGEKATIHVERTATIDRGTKGTWRVVSIHGGRDRVEVYISPTGQLRVFMKDKRFGTAEMTPQEWRGGVAV